MTYISTGTTRTGDLGSIEFGAIACNLCRKTVPDPGDSEGHVWAETAELHDLTEDWTNFSDQDLHICPDHIKP